MSRAQQPSILSFFQPRRQPEYAAPPSSAPPRNSSSNGTTAVALPPPLSSTAEPRNRTSNSTAAKPITIPVALPLNGAPALPSPPSLPSGATIAPLAGGHIAALRRINSLLLPVAYPDSFYTKALDPLASGLFSRAVLWQDSGADSPKVVGGLICRLEPNPFLDQQGQPLLGSRAPSSNPQRESQADSRLNTPYHAIYIQSLALLSPYRSLGLAAAALEHIIASAALLPVAGSSIDARTIYAHVWTENEEGLKWYEARGFRRDGEPVKGYYFKLRPDSAWIVRRQIGAGGGAQTLAGPVPAPASTASPPTEAAATQVPATRAGPQGAVLTAAINLPLPAGPSPTPAVPPPFAGGSAPPPRSRPAPSPAPSSKASSSSLSFQNARPETEWNDLPADMVASPTPGQGSSSSSNSSSQQHLPPHSSNGSGPASGSSSATARKRKERAYPSAAFGPQGAA